MAKEAGTAHFRTALPHLAKVPVWSQVGFVAIIVLISLVDRLPFYWHTVAPLNDGGLFAQIIDELVANHLRLPLESNYNFLHMPMAYPPVGFYLGALARLVSGASSFVVLRWLPLLLNLATVAAFYFLALELLAPPILAFWAGTLYAVLPRSSEWLTMGGGMTRAPGELFVVLALFFFARCANRSRNWAVLAGVAAALAMLTHLEAGLVAAVSITVLAFWPSGRTRKYRLTLLVIAGATAIVVVMPWVLWCLVHFGWQPFASALSTRGRAGSTSLGLSGVEVAGWVVFGLLLTFFRQPPFAWWVLAIDVVVSRSAATHTVLVYALLGAWLLGFALDALSTRFHRMPEKIRPRVTLVWLLLCTALAVVYVRGHLLPGNPVRNIKMNSRITLSSADLAGMKWVREHTGGDGRFFVFNQRIDPWFRDYVGEWFPYLARRQSVYTAQGREWLPQHAFQTAADHIPVCDDIQTSEQLTKVIEPFHFDAMFLAGPYDAAHARCADFLRSLPGFQNVYLRGDVEVLVRQGTSLR